MKTLKLNTSRMKSPVRVSQRFLLNLGMYVMFTCFAVFSSISEANAQDPHTVYKDWLILGEDQTNHIDVSFRVVKCTATSGDQIHLRVFNENAATKTTSFTVTITDVATNQSTTAQVSNYQLAIGEMATADCNNSSPLRIAVPAGYTASNLTVTITF